MNIKSFLNINKKKQCKITKIHKIFKCKMSLKLKNCYKIMNNKINNYLLNLFSK